MKILQLCNKFPWPAKDGGAIATFNLIKSFSSMGCEITVLAMNTSKHKFNLAHLPEDVNRMADFHAVDVDNEVRKSAALICFLQNKSYHIERFISSAFNEKLIALLHEKEFDMIQMEGLYLSPYTETIRAFSQAKIVMRAHNVEHEIWEMIAKNEKNSIKRIYLTILAKQLRSYELSRLNKYDFMVPISEPDAKKLKSYGCELPVHVCHAAYDETSLKPDKSNIEFPSLFFIGSLDWLPNQEGLIWFLKNVWNKLHTQFPGLIFHIAGRNAGKFEIPAGHKENIIVAGEVDDAYTFMNSKAIMIVPLLSGSGMRVKIIEGMALGKTIVSTPLGAAGIPCKDGQNILIADTPEAFAEKIIRCINEKIFFTVIGDNARQFAKRQFSSMEITSKLLEFYKQHLATA